MHPLESRWFLRMVERQAATPAGRLLAVFRVVGDWAAAPATRALLHAESRAQQGMPPALAALRGFLVRTARAAHARQPEILAEQLLLLLRGAIAQELRCPDSRALEQAARAAEVALAHACRRHSGRVRFLGGFAAGILATFVVLHALTPDTTAPVPPLAAYNADRGALQRSDASPDTMMALRLLHQRLAHGECPAPQMLALNHEQLDGYMQIVNFSPAGHGAADWHNMQAFLVWYAPRSTECYIPPSNGHTNVAWVSRPS